MKMQSILITLVAFLSVFSFKISAEFSDNCIQIEPPLEFVGNIKKIPEANFVIRRVKVPRSINIANILPKVFTIVTLSVNYTPGEKKFSIFLQPKHEVEVLLTRNKSSEIGIYENFVTWEHVGKSNWSEFKSPFKEFYLDIKVAEDFDGEVRVTCKEEFSPIFLGSFLLALILLYLSNQVSDYVPIYYFFGAVGGILALVLIFLFQLAKLVPGNKWVTRLTFAGSVLGVGSIAVNAFHHWWNTCWKFSRVLAESFVDYFGLERYLVDPVLGLGISIILATGAGLGVLFVRKAVVTSEGKIDEFTAKTVKWALRFVGGILLIQSSKDETLAILFLIFFGVLTIFGPGVLLWPFKKKEKPVDRVRVERNLSEEFERENDAFAYTGTPSSVRHRRPAPPIDSSPMLDTTVPSSIHQSPYRRSLRREEAKDLTEECTRQALRELGMSPQFGVWAMQNVERVNTALRARNIPSTNETEAD